MWVCVCVCMCVMSEWDVIRANNAAARCSLKTMIILYDYSRIKTMGVSCDSAWSSSSFSDAAVDNGCKEPCYGFKNDVPKWKICLVTVFCRSPFTVSAGAAVFIDNKVMHLSAFGG